MSEPYPTDLAPVAEDWNFQRELLACMPLMQRYAYGFTGGKRHAAEDLLQDTMLKAWQKAGQFLPGAPMRPWLYAIMKHQMVDESRKTSRSLELYGDEVFWEWVAETCTQPCDFVERIDLGQAIARLPHTKRTVIILMDILEKSHQELQEALNAKLGAVKSMVWRSRKTLRHLLGEAYALPGG